MFHRQILSKGCFMVDKKKIRLKMSLIINIIIIILESAGTVICASNAGLEMFRFYTTDSNIFNLTVCIVFVFFTVRALYSKTKRDIPKAVRILKYISVCSLNVTFLVVVIIFAPALGDGGYGYMLFNGDFLYFHFACPLLSLFSFILFEGGAEFVFGYSLAAIMPTVIYGAAAVLLNILRIMEGPYPFLLVYEQPVYFSVLFFLMILGFTFLSAVIIQKLGSKIASLSKIQTERAPEIKTAQ